MSNNPCDERPYAIDLATVADIGRDITAILDLPTQLQTLVERLKTDFDYYGVNIWLLTEPAESAHLSGSLSPNGEDLSRREISLPIDADDCITTVCRTGSYHLNDTISNPADLPTGAFFPEARSQLVLPLTIAQKRVGALELLSRRTHAFHQGDLVLLLSLADQATIAIRNASLYQAEQSRRHLSEKLYEISLALSSTLHIDEVLELILKLLSDIVPAERLALMLRSGDEMEFMATRGFPPQSEASNMRMPLHNDRIFDHIYTHQQPLAIPDAHLYPDWQQRPDLPITRSWLGVPLIVNKQAIGMLSLAREHLQPYTYSEVTLAQTFAGQAAIALENARLYHRLEQFNQQLEQRVEERTKELQVAYHRLEQLDATKTSFIQVTSHELRTPLTVLLGYSQILMQNHTVAGDPLLRQLSDGIFSGADRLHDIVNSMLDIIKIDSNALELNPEPLSVNLVLRNVAGNYKNALRHRQISLQIDDLSSLPAIEADGAALQKVFYQLLSNAIKYTPDGGNITIHGVFHPEHADKKAAIEIVLADSGIGIAADQQDLIFTKFYQTGEIKLHSTSRTQFKGGGPGLGLAIARGIIQAHGGKLWVESPGYDETHLPGSTFHVLLPITVTTPGRGGGRPAVSPGATQPLQP